MVAPGSGRDAGATQAGVICLEPGLGGRLFESFNTAAGEQVVEMGHLRLQVQCHHLERYVIRTSAPQACSVCKPRTSSCKPTAHAVAPSR